MNNWFNRFRSKRRRIENEESSRLMEEEEDRDEDEDENRTPTHPSKAPQSCSTVHA
jgi:hypothetical protein